MKRKMKPDNNKIGSEKKKITHFQPTIEEHIVRKITAEMTALPDVTLHCSNAEN